MTIKCECVNFCNIQKEVIKTYTSICGLLPIAYNVLVWFCKMCTEIDVGEKKLEPPVLFIY